MTAPEFIWIGPRGEDAEVLSAIGGVAAIACCDWSPALAGLGIPIASVERERGERRLWGSGTMRKIALPAPSGALRVQYAPTDSVSPALSPPVAWRCLDDKLAQTDLFRELGIPHPPTRAWRFGDGLPSGRTVLRRRRGALGLGTMHVTGDDGDVAPKLPKSWRADESLLAAPFVDGPVVNAHLVVGEDDHRVSWPSIQLFGEPECGVGANRFLYCGNDLAAADALPEGFHAELADSASRVAAALRPLGYQGILGLDFVWDGVRALLLEMNLRMQGSTALLSAAERDHGSPTISNHLAALGTRPWRPGPVHPLRGAEVVIYHEGATAVATALPPLPPGVFARGFPVPGTRVAPGAALGRLRFNTRVTSEQGRLDNAASKVVDIVRKSCAS